MAKVENIVRGFVEKGRAINHACLPQGFDLSVFAKSKWDLKRLSLRNFESMYFWTPTRKALMVEDCLARVEDVSSRGYDPFGDRDEKHDEDMVRCCRAWLLEHTRPSKHWWHVYPATSYGFKHIVEKAAGRSITNGAFIQAALLEGYAVLPFRDLNTVFRFRYISADNDEAATIRTKDVNACAAKYKISKEQVRELLSRTVCDICDEPLHSRRNKKIDHSHETGIVRGVLCNGCNTALGHIERFDREGLMDKVIEYLRRGYR